MEHISKSIVGRKLPCPKAHCKGLATVVDDNGRYKTRCNSCGDNTLLENYKTAYSKSA